MIMYTFIEKNYYLNFFLCHYYLATFIITEAHVVT